MRRYILCCTWEPDTSHLTWVFTPLFYIISKSFVAVRTIYEIDGAL